LVDVNTGHLHAGNVAVVGGKTCCLMDIENWMLGVPSYYRPFFTQFKKINVRSNFFASFFTAAKLCHYQMI
jgi:hypothetical protein